MSNYLASEVEIESHPVVLRQRIFVLKSIRDKD